MAASPTAGVRVGRVGRFRPCLNRASLRVVRPTTPNVALPDLAGQWVGRPGKIFPHAGDFVCHLCVMAAFFVTDCPGQTTRHGSMAHRD
jgi:hypothetical protein